MHPHLRFALPVVLLATMRRLALTLVSLLLLVACTDQPMATEAPRFANAGGLGAEEATIPISGSLDLCGFDVVDFTGEYQYVTRFALGDAEHMHHWFANEHWRLWFVGRNTDYTWRSNEVVNAQSQWRDPSGPDEWFIRNQHLHIIGFGGAPSFDALATVRYTMNANLEVVQEFDRIDPLCE